LLLIDILKTTNRYLAKVLIKTREENSKPNPNRITNPCTDNLGPNKIVITKRKIKSVSALKNILVCCTLAFKRCPTWESPPILPGLGNRTP